MTTAHHAVGHTCTPYVGKCPRLAAAAYGPGGSYEHNAAFNSLMYSPMYYWVAGL